MTARLVVLVSGAGSNAQALIDASAAESYGATVVAVGADRPDIGGLELARRAGIPSFVHRVSDFDGRDAFDAAVAASTAEHAPDLVVSAGFLKLLGEPFMKLFGGRFVNTHNSLLPSFPGMRGPAAALEYGVKVTGATLFMVDSGVDTGQIIAQVPVPVHDDDTVDTLTERIKVAERAQLVESVGRMVREGWRVDGRRVIIGRPV
ncbi:MAG TPA: phosphoribosylglycinamide formyltransferase [Stackebrandtia sp.]|jgi:phosphoribosylglycinamide formyltransferase-1|uniref:phosphoribosylglycinamide formyltransferase n=1 Tax=Stackebrandtia sp. TaxID=2023065 RepID=UPI002D4B08AE|nr:phosphoribosylglycinamide formyltransferase [Stackebrandtia sp.]HZE38570.1 phosphoribosylglycinamide formyltransferase [Stackebrandtia sp.]